MSEHIVIRVAADGEVRAETVGVKGPGCLASVELLEDLLDAQATSSALTAEYERTGADDTEVIEDELPGR